MRQCRREAQPSTRRGIVFGASKRSLGAMLGAVLAGAILSACIPGHFWPSRLRIDQVDPETPGSCAWFGDRHGDTLYFGISGYWDALRQSGNPSEALERREAPKIGRFNLRDERMDPPLSLDSGPERGGVWDVLVLDDRRLIYTGLSERAGWIDLESGVTEILPDLGSGANEIASLARGDFAVTQYFEASILIFEAGGGSPKRIPLSHETAQVAPKSLAYDPARGSEGWLWLTTDLFQKNDRGSVEHDARAIDLATGAEPMRIATPELQNIAFGGDGTGFFVWSDSKGLVLQILEAGESPGPHAGRKLSLAPDFDATRDFAQDIVIEELGHVVITLWSGRVFVVDAKDQVRSISLPRDPPGSLYYSAALRGDRICATRCGGIAVVCATLP